MSNAAQTMKNAQAKSHNLQITNNIKNRKERTRVLWLPSSSVMINRLVFWHFLLDQTCATLHPLEIAFSFESCHGILYNFGAINGSHIQLLQLR